MNLPNRSEALPGKIHILIFLLLAVFGFLAYQNSFSVPFIFDDRSIILTGNDFIHRPPVWSQGIWLKRSLTNLTFALNYFLHGETLWGYHFVNLMIHICNSFLIFEIVRKTLSTVILPHKGTALTSHKLSNESHGLRPKAEESRNEILRYAQDDVLAFSTALLWLVHPLATQAVTYTVQRQESLMGFFYLATLYSFIRSEEGNHSWGWKISAVLSCILGQMSKEIMATAPLMILAYDRLFISGSFMRAVKNKIIFYGALFSSWYMLFTGLPLTASESMGFAMGISPWEYLRTQPGVILHYLKLSIVPFPLCFDYLWPVAVDLEDILLPSTVVGSLAMASLWAFWKKNPASFCGVWFFLILAPTSSIFPLLDLAAEHRMYLPLAGLVSFTVAAFYRLFQTRIKPVFFLIPVFTLAGLLTAMTWARNQDYKNEEMIWKDVLRQRPENYRAHYNLATYYREHDKDQEAIPYFVNAIGLKPSYADAQNSLGSVMHRHGQIEIARNHYRMALAGNSKHLGALNNMGISFLEEGKPEEAIPYLEKARELYPENKELSHNLEVARQAVEAQKAGKQVAISPVFMNLKQ
ncbi:MAG: tetratricopeptide repeat protein [Candidatus Omnitrophica bacterium]|nr:tetratricopeptide repeat protein [Candidatus Omnitrophota bacterium]